MIQTIDFYILDAIQNLRCGFLDYIMPKITFLGSGGLVILGLIIGNGMLKNIIARERPNWLNPSVQLLIGNPTDFSFPSGHTLASFSCVFIMFYTKDKLRYAVLVLAIFIAFSRLYLYVHFPSDILGAIVLSFLISLIAYAANRRYNSRKQISPPRDAK